VTADVPARIVDVTGEVGFTPGLFADRTTPDAMKARHGFGRGSPDFARPAGLPAVARAAVRNDTGEAA
jgi:hypothetical protein